MTEDLELVTVAEFRETAEAEMAKLRLHSAGIDCFLVGENTAQLYGTGLGGLQLQVNPEDEADARAVLSLVAAPGDAESAEAADEVATPTDAEANAAEQV